MMKIRAAPIARVGHEEGLIEAGIRRGTRLTVAAVAD
jgi:hypothetical protein